MVASFQHNFANEYRIININDAVNTRSIAIAGAHALRGCDAVHFGAALEVNGRSVTLGAGPLLLVTSHNELLTAAVAEGLLTDDPNAYC